MDTTDCARGNGLSRPVLLLVGECLNPTFNGTQNRNRSNHLRQS
ncbi:Uncharacterised protein [Vibrio cholerae]|nr:Uncharacterised protein [Vibrio cholerae]CSH95356.1 Uncharacterised protein [Vibrio cholerae]